LDNDPIKIRDEISNRVRNHDYTKGPLLLLAGPGTGKTYSLLETIKTQLDKGLDHSDFFEATLTNAAANDFITDAKNQITPDFDSSSTLHSRAKGILHQHAVLLGLNPNFTVLDEKYKGLVLGDVCHILVNFDGEISEELSHYQKAEAKYLPIKSDFSFIYQKIQLFYAAIDWFDVVKLACGLLENYREVRDAECNKFNFLLIDEYQDLNPAEQRFVELLLNGRTNLLAVGDDDQSIYSSFRYADPEGITKFNLRYPNAQKQVLPVTTRLPSKVIDASYSLISNNETHDCSKAKIFPLDKTDKRADVGFVISVNLKSGKAEREFIGKAINNLLNGENKVPPNEILVLCNCSALGIELIEAIQDSQYQIPIQNYLEQTQIVNPSELIFEHLCKFISNQGDNLSLRMILDKLLEPHSEDSSFLVKHALWEEISLWETIRTHKVTAQLHNTADVVEKFVRVVQKAIRFDNLKDQLNCILTEISPLSDLLELLEHKDQQSDNITDEEVIDKVRFLTLHSSKGLDADFVFIPFMEESIDLNPADIEEKRRLLYVAITRAKVGVIFSWAWSRHSNKRYKCAGHGRGPRRYREPSPLIKECVINPTLCAHNAKPSSSEVALQILSKHAACVYSFDNS